MQMQYKDIVHTNIIKNNQALRLKTKFGFDGKISK
jgi:hypothetical protein